MFDKKKLETIRKKEARGEFDPENNEHFGPFLNQFGAEWNLEPGYSGLVTFFRAPPSQDYKNADIALIGVPFERGLMERSGAKNGPRALREKSLITCGPLHHVSKIIPFQLCKLIDAGDVPLESWFSLDKGISEIKKFYQNVIKAGCAPLSAGGDHSITYPILKAVGSKEPVALVHIDSHCDTAGLVGGSRVHHGGPFRNAVLDGVLDPERTVQIGIRGRAEPWWDFSYKTGMRVIHIEEFHEMGIKEVIRQIHEVIGSSPTYITFDVDGLDPVFAPGTGTPEVGGLTTIEAQAIIRGLRGANIIGGDVVEVSPPWDDPAGTTAHSGATMMWEILCVLAEAIAR